MSGIAGISGIAGGPGIPSGCGGQGGARGARTFGTVPDCAPLFRSGGTVAGTVALNGQLRTADLNGDGKPDLISVDTTHMEVFVNDGADHFTGRGTTGVTLRDSFDVATGDLNGDGITDVALAFGRSDQAPQGPQLGVFLNKGDGTFNAEVRYDLPVNGIAVAIGDLDGDNRGDVLVSGSEGTYRLSNQGDGQLAPPMVVGPTGSPVMGGQDVEITDFDGDGKLDFGIVHPLSGLEVWINQGDWAFSRATIQPVLPSSYASSFFQPLSFVVADMNQDGAPDLVVRGYVPMLDFGPEHAEIALNDGRGTFTTSFLPVGLTGTGNGLIVPGDFNGDRRKDFAVGTFFQGTSSSGLCAINGTISTFMAQADGTYPQTACASTIATVGSMVAADFDGDGKSDLAFLTGTGVGFQGAGIGLQMSVAP
jgi:hypothetical protein